MRTRSKLWMAALLAVGAVASACSSGAGGTSASGTGATISTSGSSAPIKVGVLCNCSGGGSQSAEAVVGNKTIEAWAKAVNAAGGISGHPVKLIEKDGGFDPGKSVTAANSLISSDVDVILDLDTLAASWAKLVDAAKIPVIGGDLSSDLVFTDPNFYPAGGTPDVAAESVIRTAKQAGAKNLGVLYCTESPTCAEIVKAERQLGNKFGLPLGYSASIAGTATNYTAQCVAAKQAAVGAVFVAAAGSVMQRVAKDCDQQGYNPIYIQLGTGFTPNLTSTPGLSDGLWIIFSLAPYFADLPAMQRMNRAIDGLFPGLRSDRVNWSEYAVQAWAAGVLLEQAVRAGGVSGRVPVSAAQITKGLARLRRDTLGGLSAPLTYASGKAHSVPCWFVGRVESGKLAVVDGGKPSCATGS